MSLITDIYSITQKFPSHELYGLTSQTRRAACSIALNIAEGYGRQSTKSYIQFLKISRGSLLELETCIHIAMNLNYISSKESKLAMDQMEEIIKMLNTLIKTLNNKAVALESNTVA